MRSLSRAAMLTLGAAVALGSAGCAAAPPLRHHNHRPIETEDDPKPPPPLGPWTDFGRLSTFQAAGDVSHSAHRVGTDYAHVSRSPDAEASLKGAQPEGALFVEALSAGPEAPVDVYFVMRKSAGTANQPWEYLVANPDGTLAARGKLELCVRCHAEAGPTGLFGL